MKELTEWWQEMDGASRRWLLLGKGPSFGTRAQYDLRPYTTIAVNHVVREMRVDVMSAVNYDVVGDCGDVIYENARYLLMPRYPHALLGEGPRLLETYFDDYPVLKRMDSEGRLVWYNLSCDPLVSSSPVIRNGPFSVCILFHLLGTLGGRHLRTLGVDGGLSYANAFHDMNGTRRLAGGQPTYDNQFKEMMGAVKKYGLHYAPLNKADPHLRLLTLWHLIRHHIRFDPGRARRLRRQGLTEAAGR